MRGYSGVVEKFHQGGKHQRQKRKTFTTIPTTQAQQFAPEATSTQKQYNHALQTTSNQTETKEAAGGGPGTCRTTESLQR